MKRVAAQVDCGRLYGGTHEPRVVRAAGAQYVIKRTKPCEYGEPSKENGNETLANVLASQVGVRVADCAAVAVASDFTWGDDAAGYGPGEYFGSLYLPEFSPILAPELSRINEHYLYLIYAFDLWLCNPDRKAGDLLGKERRDLVSDVIAIDHGNVLTGSHWSGEHLNEHHETLPGPVENWLFWSYNNVDAARLAAERLRRSDHDINTAIAEASNFWRIDDGETVLRFLNARLEILEELLRRNIERAKRGPEHWRDV